MAGVYGEIGSRKDFLAMLEDTTRQTKQLSAASLGDTTIASILKQLEAITTWTSKGREPTRQERASIDIAVRAAREFEDDPALYEWTRKLYALDAYVEDWPNDEQAANASDDEFFDDDEDE